MDKRTFVSRTMPDNGMAAPAGYPASCADPGWRASYRDFLDLMARNVRLLAWIFAGQGAVLFFLVAASLASAEFGIGMQAFIGGETGGEELFTRGAADPGDAPNIRP